MAEAEAAVSPTTPTQRCAVALIEYFTTYGSRSTPEMFVQMMAEVSARLGQLLM